jgi:hypothetical protein
MGTLLAPDYPALGALALYVGVGTAVLSVSVERAEHPDPGGRIGALTGCVSRAP